ncbi:MAG: PQQ-binding-like beta-propeller repeat protein [Thermoplasmatales archaeon]|nr:PQQ-binding-like beta-propeller repeat protein [Thermoplasmatales archaeon]
MNKNILAIGITILFTLSVVSPIVFGYNVRTSNEESMVVNDSFDIYMYPEFYDCYNTDEIPESIEPIIFENEVNLDIPKTENIVDSKDSPEPLSGPMDSAWPMHGHDVRHTGRSPHSTVDTWEAIWKFETKGWALSSPAIDKEGTIYIGSWDLYAVYPNGTIKWERDDGDLEHSCPAIDENGTIYIGTPGALCAVNPDGTTKWKYGASGVESSPAIGDDGTIYFADTNNWNIKALYPNGTLKWSYHTNHVIYSSPAIGLDGTIYCGSHDDYVYALYPNNGTLRWKFKTGSWVHGYPTIADDGIVYIGSDDNHLYALYPNNGTLKWKVNIGATFGSVALDKDGTIYVGVWQKRFYAICPNGTIKWSFNTGDGKVWSSSPALSDDNTIYFGTCDLEWTGGIEIIALYTDGTVKWRKGLDTVFSSPAIAEDGTVYIGSCGGMGKGFLNAFGVGELEVDANGPYFGLINEPVQFEGYSRGGYSPHFYHWSFGDGESSDEQNPTHTYSSPGNYTVTLTVTDDTGNYTSDYTWAWIQDGNTPPNKPTIDGPTHGTAGASYPYTFTATDPEGAIIWYYVDWGDETNTGWIGPYDSGTEVIKSHKWSERGDYTIKCKAKDPYEAEGPEGTLKVTMPRDKATISMLFLRFLEHFPILQKMLLYLIE